MVARSLVLASTVPDCNYGWKRGEGDMVFGNPKAALIYHVVWVEEDPTAPGGFKILYDQILRCEAGGGMSVVIDEQGRIGLMQAFRPQTKDQEAWRKAWPNVDVSKLGRPSWELPRGFAKVDESGAESGTEAARRETEEETQSIVTTSRSIGYVCDNTASAPHLTAMQIATVDQSRRPQVAADPNEKFLAPLTWFTREQIRDMVRSGEIYCGYTLSGIAKWLLEV